MSVVLFVAALILVPFFLGLIWLGLYAAYFMSMAHMLMRVGLKIGHLIALGSLITVMFAIICSQFDSLRGIAVILSGDGNIAQPEEAGAG